MGALRAKYGHREPYRLKYIQVDNERPITRGYIECVKKVCGGSMGGRS